MVASVSLLHDDAKHSSQRLGIAKGLLHLCGVRLVERVFQIAVQLFARYLCHRTIPATPGTRRLASQRREYVRIASSLPRSDSLPLAAQIPSKTRPRRDSPS